jgi:hypothetical protein
LCKSIGNWRYFLLWRFLIICLFKLK